MGAQRLECRRRRHNLCPRRDAAHIQAKRTIAAHVAASRMSSPRTPNRVPARGAAICNSATLCVPMNTAWRTAPHYGTLRRPRRRAPHCGHTQLVMARTSLATRAPNPSRRIARQLAWTRNTQRRTRPIELAGKSCNNTMHPTTTRLKPCRRAHAHAASTCIFRLAHARLASQN